MAEIITLGEILVEIMSRDINQSFSETGTLIGPFPSGAPAIFINQASKVGSRTAIFSVIGNDDFGKINYQKLKDDGVDTSYIEVTEKLPTGVAFVTYQEDGNRDFIFHIQNSAAGLLSEGHIVPEAFNNCNYFHIMGSALFNDNLRKAAKKAIGICKERGIKISFDPNIRKELLEDSAMKNSLDEMYEACDIFLPSEEELGLFVDIEDEKEAVESILNKGKEYVVIKKGNKGSSAYSKNETYHYKPIDVEEVDPTGAGDCFGGTFISCLNQGFEFKEAVSYANIAGALAVTKKGPMAGNSTLDMIKNFNS